MASCEKCWDEAYRRFLYNPFRPQAEHYHQILSEWTGRPCTPEEQAGQFWGKEKQIDRRFRKRGAR